MKIISQVCENCAKIQQAIKQKFMHFLNFSLPPLRILQSLPSHCLNLTWKVGSLLTLKIRKFLTWKKQALALKQDPFMLKVECKLSPPFRTFKCSLLFKIVGCSILHHLCSFSFSPYQVGCLPAEVFLWRTVHFREREIQMLF